MCAKKGILGVWNKNDPEKAEVVIKEECDFQMYVLCGRNSGAIWLWICSKLHSRLFLSGFETIKYTHHFLGPLFAFFYTSHKKNY